ncbi:MAG: hypothetical protein WCC90_07345 [Methylocella sp.]
MEPTPKIILAAEDDTPLKIGQKVEAEIRERIALLERRIVTYRKHGMPSGRDQTELERLRAFLESLGLALAICLAVACMPPLARADDLDASPPEGLPLLAGRAPCGPYMAARTCLDAIRMEAQECIARKFKGDATPAQQLACINEALARTGALDD